MNKSFHSYYLAWLLNLSKFLELSEMCFEQSKLKSVRLEGRHQLPGQICNLPLTD